MRKLLLCLAVLFAAVGLRAATEITAYIQITNVPAGLTTNITVNIGTADTRHWTNDPTGAPATGIRTTNTTVASVTNLLTHFATYPVYSVGAGSPQALFAYSTTNTTNFTITAPLNTNLTVTFGGNWAKVFYVTSTFADAYPIMAPTNTMSPRVRTNALNAIVNLLSATNMVPSNSVPPGAKALQHYADNVTAQTSSNKTLTAPIINGGRTVNSTNFTGTNIFETNVTLRFVSISGLTDVSGFISSLTNGSLFSNYLFYSTLSNPVTYSLINYSNAIRSEGQGGNSLQVGSNAAALSLRAIAIGNSAIATNTDAIAIGTGATATNTAAVAIGTASAASGVGAIAIGGSGTFALNDGALAFGGNASAQQGAVAIGADASSQGTNGVALGNDAIVDQFAYSGIALGRSARGNHSNSVALGPDSATTANDQIRLGVSGQSVSIPGALGITGITSPSTITNHITTGTNRFNARLDFTARNNTSLANGYNSGVILGSNVYIRCSGPSGAYTNAGWAAEVDGSYHILEFDNPVANMTILDNSGLDATAANRITTGTGALVNYTNNPVIIGVIYNATAARWRLIRTMPTP